MESIDNAATQGVQILCFPETQTFGYRVDIAAADEPVEAFWVHTTRRCSPRWTRWPTNPEPGNTPSVSSA